MTSGLIPFINLISSPIFSGENVSLVAYPFDLCISTSFVFSFIAALMPS